MEHYDVKRAFQGKLATGFTALALSFVAANLIWPIWSLAMQKLYLAIAGPTLTLLDAHLTSKLTSVVAEGTFFWMVINTWIWMTLVMNNSESQSPRWLRLPLRRLNYLTVRKPMKNAS